ncbi:hypothetical protein BC939DRAFT_195455 [Gamsiella multidivaricata]|uniref:uncharacterized protein n=1 Tax=Gamsiella multidivaricata TaxID=101098 RepID=UPI00221F6E65|nr:uncharacterized protein BC939DRAFT_195455 [Gamsiella multidivaricata]KAG0368782.1 hypothetical protein BGZ54_001151 [Gamsiella multidivaricata]KAI7821992.1 hypothetical protein BC939DRAFT_195455 [Gamsiella multidivaricata]
MSKDSSVEDAPAMTPQARVLSMPELAYVISPYLARNDICAMMNINRTWMELGSFYLYENLTFRGDQSIFYISKRYQYIKSLDFKYVGWNRVESLLGNCINLRSLTFSYRTLRFSELQEIVGLAPRLQDLHITLCHYNTESVCLPISIVARLTDLRELEWESLSEIRVDDVLFIVKSCPYLHTLILGAITPVERFSNIGVMRSRAADLKDLVRVDESGWASMSLQSLTFNYPRLEGWYPSSNGPDSVHPFIRRFFRHVPNLRKIGISCQPSDKSFQAADFDYMRASSPLAEATKRPSKQIFTAWW